MTTRALPMLPMLEPARSTPAGQASTAQAPDPQLAEFVTDDLAMPRFHVWTLGCQMNRSDSEEMAGALAAAGCAEAASMDAADLIVINSCAIREAAEQKVIGRMGALARLRQANPALRVVLAGCSVRDDNAATLRRRYPQVDLFLRPDEEPELVARLGLATATAPGVMRQPGSARMPEAVRRESTFSAWLPIIYGCDKTCTYCIVPFSRGRERSRAFDEVVSEAAGLSGAGYREVTLLGQNVNSYGHDLAPDPRFAAIRGGRTLGRRLDLDGRPDIAALLHAIDGLRTADGVPAIPRLRFVTSHPWDLTDRLIDAMADCPSVCEHLHLPVQSGDDAVLRRMGRQYTIDSYLALVERLRARVPDICLTTDVIVGFCAETDEQFENTLELLRAVRFEQVFAAAFSVRPGTPAARLADDVPAAEKKRRLNALLDVQEEISRAANAAWVGRTTEVLVDQLRPPSSHDGDGELRVAGRNRQNKLVHLPGGPELVGRLAG
ncbi:MAG TPA: MiaB/RimO family radical SAM methylthiotransferase [Candidatus Limnocylindria bacterium]|nr:MiaB/RimO family radical SAM methylthiotransferase [Candidatus Limnocylindria bacterium]